MTESTASGSKPTVLVVDDTPQNLSLMCDLLEQDYVVKLAPGGERALKICASAPPDLILLDIMMPEMDGYEVCRRLKADPATARIPIIFVTARVEEDDEERGFALGAVDYITKPVRPALVRARVRTHLHIKQTHEALEQRNRNDRERYEQVIAQQVELNALKSSYLSMATHEFRTPLTTILSALELLETSTDKLPAEERLEMLGDMRGAALRMSMMIDDVLEMGRSEVNLRNFSPGPLTLEPVLRHLIAEAHTGHRVKYAERPVSPVVLDLAPDCQQAVADEKLLRHIVGNLLANALKYTTDGSEVRFEVRRGPGVLQCMIVDQGIGIPVADQPHLFGTFFRASNVGRIPGTGLGLAIVKRATETHGGGIAFESAEGKGSRFTVTLPQPD